MRKSSIVFIIVTLIMSTMVFAKPINVKTPKIELKLLGTYTTGIYDDSAAEIVAYDAKKHRLYVTNASDKSIDVISISKPKKPKKNFSIDLEPFGSPNSVTYYQGVIAVAAEAENKQQPGSVVLFDQKGKFLNSLKVGALPDMLVFTPDGSRILVANEGEPNDDYTVDPEGSISVINVSRPINEMTQEAVKIADFRKFNKTKLDKSIRIFGPGATVAKDLEPEYIAVSEDSKTAWVSLQENNALAIVDITTAQVTSLVGLGSKSFSNIQNAIDASDKDNAINIRTWPVLGFYQPDAIATYEYEGQTYIVTANEGDARDYAGFSEEARAKDLSLSPTLVKGFPNLQKNKHLGRLKTTTVNGDINNDGLVEQIYAYGARSFSIWNSKGEIIFDSGSDFARITSAAGSKIFNGNDKRSDDKGAEPEALTVGKIGKATFAFIGLERTSGIMVYDVSNPYSPFFVQYINNLNLQGEAEKGTAGDIAPEGMVFVSAKQSPVRQPLLVVSNEVSGTTSVYEVKNK